MNGLGIEEDVILWYLFGQKDTKTVEQLALGCRNTK